MKSCRVKKPRLAPLDVRVLGTIGATPRTFAREDLVAVEVAAVGHGGDLVAARGLLCLERHGRKLLAVVPLISHLVRHDQMVLRVDGDLHVVADRGSAFATGCHRSGVGIGQRDLLVGRVLNRLLPLLRRSVIFYFSRTDFTLTTSRSS